MAEADTAVSTADAISPSLIQAVGENQQQIKDAAAAPVADWRQMIPANLRGEKMWETFKSADDAFKSHVELAKYRGQNPRIPGPDATPEEIKQFHKRLGVPDTPDGYQIKRPEVIPAGIQYNEEMEKSFLTKAHQSGLTPQQTQGLLDYWNSDVMPKMAAGRPSEEEVTTKLKETWGPNYQANVDAIDRFTRMYSVSEKAAEAFDMLPLEHQVELQNVLAKAGAATKEGSSIDVTQRGSVDTDRGTLERRKAEIFSNPAYSDKSHPMHKMLVAENLDITRRLGESHR